jgi:cell division protein FtsB
MIILAVLGTASTVIVRMRSELRFSTQQYQRTASEIEILRRGNAMLGTEINRITNDPRMIESVARSRLGMVRPNDIVVPTEPRERSNLGALLLAR